MLWSDWSPHAPLALTDLQEFAAKPEVRAMGVSVLTAVPPGTRRADIDFILAAHRIQLPEIAVRADRVPLTGALNQIPAELLFRDGVLVDRRLGPMSTSQLSSWVRSAVPSPTTP
jgi:hypothetical protein